EIIFVCYLGNQSPVRRGQGARQGERCGPIFVPPILWFWPRRASCSNSHHMTSPAAIFEESSDGIRQATIRNESTKGSNEFGPTIDSHHKFPHIDGHPSIQ